MPHMIHLSCPPHPKVKHGREKNENGKDDVPFPGIVIEDPFPIPLYPKKLRK